MKSKVIIAVCLLAATVAVAQQAPVDPSQKPVATVNGEIITKAKLDHLYASLAPQMRQQYDQAGGKVAYLENYVAKRLMIQEAMKSGFDKKPEVIADLEMIRESALFDRYVRETVGTSVVSEADVRKYYEENLKNFATPELVKVRHIVAAESQTTTRSQALAKIQKVLAEIRAAVPQARATTPESERLLVSRFSEAARKYSEDGVAPQGGDLGWAKRGQFDQKFEEAAFSIPKGVLSGIVESSFGYHLILVEDKKPAGSRPFEEVRNGIRDLLLQQKATEVVTGIKRLTNELFAQSKVSYFPENVQ